MASVLIPVVPRSVLRVHPLPLPPASPLFDTAPLLHSTSVGRDSVRDLQQTSGGKKTQLEIQLCWLFARIQPFFPLHSTLVGSVLVFFSLQNGIPQNGSPLNGSSCNGIPTRSRDTFFDKNVNRRMHQRETYRIRRSTYRRTCRQSSGRMTQRSESSKAAT